MTCGRNGVDTAGLATGGASTGACVEICRTQAQTLENSKQCIANVLVSRTLVGFQAGALLDIGGVLAARERYFMYCKYAGLIILTDYTCHERCVVARSWGRNVDGPVEALLCGLKVVELLFNKGVVGFFGTNARLLALIGVVIGFPTRFRCDVTGCCWFIAVFVNCWNDFRWSPFGAGAVFAGVVPK